jgi:hypothetical protein
MTAKLTAGLHLMLARVAGVSLAAPTKQARTTGTFDDVMQAFAAQRYRRAFDGLGRLADGGDADAARIALLMVAHGPRLFGGRFDVALPQRTQWLELTSRNEQARRASP